METNRNEAKSYTGSCHCGAVQFRVTTDLAAGAGRCNCSICTKVSQLGGIVKPEAFQLVSNEESLSSYEWGGRTSKRYFCKQCGIHCFGRGSLPELGGAYVSVNYNCLEGVELADLKVIYWDGRHNNWHAGPRDTAWAILDAASA
ncbi:MAG TPA: GFA family protein [Polyangia bacterium]|jgi:hypothetical protein|nr:GFA family protein [Polyangia bacterium]